MDFNNLAARNTSTPGFGKGDFVSYYEEVILCIYANMIEHEHVNSLEEAKKVLDKLYNKHKGVIKK